MVTFYKVTVFTTSGFTGTHETDRKPSELVGRNVLVHCKDCNRMPFVHAGTVTEVLDFETVKYN